MCIENNGESMEEAVHKLAEEIAPMFEAMDELAYTTYELMVEDICSRYASEAEVERILDNMLGCCGTERMIRLFKKVCRRYYYLYPEMITFEVYAYRDMFEDEEQDDQHFEE